MVDFIDKLIIAGLRLFGVEVEFRKPTAYEKDLIEMINNEYCYE